VLKDNLNKVSADLRQKYPEYAWIGITKNYSQLLIDIEYQDVPPKEDLDATYSCDLISKYDGIIKSIIVKKGVVLVIPNQSVKKGDILVSGNLNVETNPNNMEKLVKADGIIIGKTLVLEKIKIKKRQESLECTGRVKNVKVISFFNKTIGKNPLTFDAYYTKITPIFNLFNILEINNIAYYEQTIVENVYDEETALRFAESKVYQEFEKKRTSDLEKIEEIKLLEISDNDEYFIISFIVSKYVNFASIRQY
jgi:similar to stage IV sporulation protein